ncbi:MAG: fibronectin type III domain-containing protein [Candidatus Liptonbacteria bacterium]|nr:fibronectin type III domain-containing protein [Candidatus Liptonbacteria bacterium]
MQNVKSRIVVMVFMVSAAIALFFYVATDSVRATAPLYGFNSFEVSAASSTQVNLTWAYSNASLVDPAITGYMIERESPVGGGFVTIAASAQGTSYSDTNLSANTVYNYRISAINADGASATRTIWVQTPSAQAQLSPPDPPQSVSAVATSGSTINISWTAAPNSPTITGYKIERGIGGSGFLAVVLNTSSTATTYTDTNLSPGSNYAYRITALSNSGPSNPSLAALATTFTLPGSPQSASAVAGDGQATVSWTPPFFTGGGITDYRITWTFNGSSSVGNVTSTVITGLTNGTSYSFNVVAINSVGSSAPVSTNMIKAGTIAAVMPAPASYSATMEPAPVPPPTPVVNDTQSLQAQINVLLIQLQRLQALANAQANTQTDAQISSQTNTIVDSQTNSSASSLQTPFARNLYVGAKGDDVATLQKLLIVQHRGPESENLADVGASGYFGQLTQKALAEFQADAGISPASGYFGPKTRGYISSLAR